MTEHGLGYAFYRSHMVGWKAKKTNLRHIYLWIFAKQFSILNPGFKAENFNLKTLTWFIILHKKTNIYITVLFPANDCPDKRPPKNGAMSCDDWALGRYCVPFCNDRWDFVQPLSIFAIWTCDAKGKWFPPVHWPDCSCE